MHWFIRWLDGALFNAMTRTHSASSVSTGGGDTYKGKRASAAVSIG
jgi:hypothetical protein